MTSDLARDHRAADRALSFGATAAAYDRVRPPYAESVLAALAPAPGGRILDVGCGTGKAAIALLERGYDVLGVEPDAEMAAVARRAGPEVEVERFEQWEPSGRIFDLVIAAQAWHWVDPVEGPAKAAAVLGAGGEFAPIWNYRSLPDAATRTLLVEIYRTVAPALVASSPLLGTVDQAEELDRHRRAIVASGSFEERDAARGVITQLLDRSQWLDLTRTQSDHGRLAPETYDRLVAAVAEALGPDGTVALEYETVALRFTRTDR